MFGLGNLLGSFGTIPDILMGKDPKQALLDNLKAAAVVMAPMALGAAGAGAAAGSGGSGLLAGGEMAAAETGLNAAGYLAPEMGAAASEGLLATPTVVNGTTAATNPGLLGSIRDGYSKIAKPLETTMKAVNMGQEMAQANQPPPIQAPVRQNMPLDLSSILNQSTQWQQYEAADNERRKALMAQYSQGIGRV